MSNLLTALDIIARLNGLTTENKVSNILKLVLKMYEMSRKNSKTA